jgi:hypothetical protein
MSHPTLRQRFTRGAIGININNKYERCTAHGCVRHVHHFGARLCGRHADRRQLHGDINATTVTIAELRAFAGYVDAGFKRFDSTPAFREALKRCHELIHFRATSSDPWEKYLETRMASLRMKRGKLVEPVDVLLVVVCLYAFTDAHPKRLPSTDSHHIALSRAVTRLGPTPRMKRPRLSEAIGAGKYIADRLGTFAVLLLRHWHELHRREAIARAAGDRRLVDFSTPNESSATPNELHRIPFNE